MRQYLHRFTARLRAVWPSSWRQQITRSGFGYFVAVLIVALGTFASGNNLLYLILAAMFSVLFISNFVSRIVMSGLQVDVAIPVHVCARRPIRCLLRLKNSKGWMPSFSIHVTGRKENGFDSALYFPLLPGGAILEEAVQAFFPKRGRLRERTFQITTRFPFGFAERRELVTLRQEIMVYPCIDPRPGFELLLASIQGEIELLQRGQGQDFHRIRPYEALESWRHLDWKSTAHTGALQVREFSQEDDEGVLIYLDLDVAHAHHAWFEDSVDCAAYLVYQLADRRRKVQFRTQEIDLHVPDQCDVYTILKYLALVDRKPGAAPGIPDKTNQYQIVFSADAARMAGLGWAGGNRGYGGGQILGLDAFATAHPSSVATSDNRKKK